MNEKEWASSIGDLVRESMQSPIYDRFYSVNYTPVRARIMIAQQGLYIRHRRDCWAHVSANCPELSVKQKILAHEYEEIIEDEYSQFGHLDLVVRQAGSVGMSPEEILNAAPLPSTQAVLYAYGWLTREKPWKEGLGALMATERGNDNRLLDDLGGGHSKRTAKKWMEDLGLTWEQVPNSAVHSQADEKHSEMFLSVLKEFVTREEQAGVLRAVKESLQLREVMYWGITEAMKSVQ